MRSTVLVVLAAAVRRGRGISSLSLLLSLSLSMTCELVSRMLWLRALFRASSSWFGLLKNDSRPLRLGGFGGGKSVKEAGRYGEARSLEVLR